jgi:ATPase subunit of ABC transporter with duplicated ATPase domains
MHKPIYINNLTFSLPHKICFENFSAQIAYGSRIAIIGRNGCGKTTLLNLLQGLIEPSDGSVTFTSDIVIEYVPQLIEECDSLSGGERLNAALLAAFNRQPNLLLLDEPTNHLDRSSRQNLLRMLHAYSGTLILASHDTELLQECIDIIWHIDESKITVFRGSYADYRREIKLKRGEVEGELKLLNREKKEMHQKLMQEQERAAKSKAAGKKKVENRKWLKMVGALKAMKAEKSQGNKLKAIDRKKDELSNQLAKIRLPEIIKPKFSIDAADILGKTLICISDGSVGYVHDRPLLSGVNFSLMGGERLALMGDNGSGKTTLIKAILGDDVVYKSGDWFTVKRDDIGYLSQHYHNLDFSQSVMEVISATVPDWSNAEIRRHLNNFLFRKNEEVMARIDSLSGGEKARLSLAQIAAKTPKLLVLDEITNNLDLETRAHVIQVLKDYPGAMVVISHDPDFLEAIEVDNQLNVEKFR